MLRPFGLSVPNSKISLISCFFRRVLSPLQRFRPQIMMSLSEWALPETFVHFLMFNDIVKSCPLTFSCFYSVAHCFPILRFVWFVGNQ